MSRDSNVKRPATLAPAYVSPRAHAANIVIHVTALHRAGGQAGVVTVLAEDSFGAIAMTALAAPKSSLQNRLEGVALTAIFQGFPCFAGAALLLRLAHHPIAGGAVFFVAATSILHGLLTPWLAPKFPKFFKNSYAPLFFDARLSFAEKLSQWRAQPAVSLQLVTNVMMLAVLAVGVASVG
jgi:hypothetical protein